MINSESENYTSNSADDSDVSQKIIKNDNQTAPDKIKVVRIIARLNVGGPARHVVWLTKELQNEEFDSVLLAGTVPEGEEDMSYFAVNHSVQPIFIEQMSREISPQDVISLWKIYRLLKREKPDIIHTHTAKAGTVGRISGFLYRWLTFKTLIGKPRSVKIIHTFHGHVFNNYYSNFKTKIFLAIEKTLARLATDKIIVISRRQFEEINEKYKVGKAAQFEIVPLGIDLDVFADWKSKRAILRNEIGAADDVLIVGLVGRLTEIKNHGLFLELIKLWQEKSAQKSDLPKLEFVIIGDGHLRQKLEDEAAALGIENSVKFLGNRNDADVFYAGLDIVALTSLNEGTPLSLIEAMANEKAVISTDVGGVGDLLGAAIEEKNAFQVCERGISVASGDAKGLHAGLEYLAANAELREKFSRRGHHFVINNYGKARLIKDIKNLYRNLRKR